MPWACYSSLLFASSMLCLAIAFFAFEKKTHLSALFALLMCAMTLWTFAYALEILSSSARFMGLMLFAEYAGIVSVPPLWLLFALEFTSGENRPGRKPTAVLSAIPVATLVLLVTNNMHHLFYASIRPVAVSGTLLFDITPGPWYWINWVYAVSCLVAGLALLLSRFRTSTGPYKRQALALFAGLAVPAAANIAYMLGARPYGHFDITPVAFSISGIAGAWGIRKHRLLELSPVDCTTIFRNLECALFVFDKRGILVEINPAARNICTCTAEPVGEPAAKALSGCPRLRELASAKNARGPVEVFLPGKNDHENSRWWSAEKTVLRDRRGKERGTALVLYDITNLKTSETARRKSEVLYRAIVENAAEVIFTLNAEGFLTYVSPAVQDLTGYEPSFLERKNISSFLHPEDLHYCLEAVKTAFGGYRASSGLEFRFLMKDGSWRWHSATFAPLRSETGEVHQVLGIAEDIQKRKEYEDHLLHVSTHDTLTGLYNRDHFDSVVERFEKGGIRPVAVIMVDCNGLKGINDSEGHAAGDMHLKKTADFLIGAFPGEAVISRIGGDEFAVLLPGLDENDAGEALQRAQKTMGNMNESSPGHMVDVSMGLAVHVDGRQTLRQVLQEADRRMYKEKSDQ